MDGPRNNQLDDIIDEHLNDTNNNKDYLREDSGAGRDRVQLDNEESEHAHDGSNDDSETQGNEPVENLSNNDTDNRSDTASSAQAHEAVNNRSDGNGCGSCDAQQPEASTCAAQQESNASEEHQKDTRACRVDEPSVEDSTENSTSQSTMQSFRFFLLGYAALFLLIVVALEIMRFASERHDGLAVASQDNHYLWTYGPTLFLTIAAAFWSQYEYRTKQMMPWIAMSSRQVSAEQSLLLDYVSASIPKVLARSVRAGHTPVATGILGTMLLRALIVTSTGLFSLRTRVYTEDIQLALQTKFNFSVIEDQYSVKGPVDPASIVWSVNHYNLSCPVGTTSTLATQTFVHPAQLRNHTIHADVDVFAADLQNCEPFQWRSPDPAYSYNTSRGGIHAFKLNVWSDSCFVEDFTFFWEDRSTNPARGSEMHGVQCSNATGQQDSNRILISMTLTTFREARQDNSSLTGVICDPVYSLTRRTLTSPAQNLNANTSLIVSDHEIQDLQFNMSLADLNDDIARAFYFGSSISDPYASGMGTWLSLMNQTFPHNEAAEFLNTEILVQASQRVFRTGVPQWMNLAHTSPAETNISGTAIFEEHKLYVEDLPLRLMEGIAILLAIICILTFIRWPAGPVPQRSGALITKALVLSESPTIQELLRGTGSGSKRTLRHNLSGFLFTIRKTATTAPFSISALRGTDDEGSLVSPDDEKKKKWWRPAAASPVFRASVIIILVILVAALETILQLSRKNQGLATVTDRSNARYAWLYGPTLTMTGIGMVFALLTSAAIVLHPFYALRRSKCEVNVMTEDPADEITLLAAIKAFISRSFSLALILTAGLVSSMLTIVASGLYTTQTVSWTGNVTLATMDWFNITHKSVNELAGTNSDGDGRVAGMIQYYNLSYPKWTYDELAFPRLHFDEFSTKNVSLSTRIPAVRARMNCSAQFYPGQNVLKDDEESGIPGIDVDPPYWYSVSNGSVAKLHIVPGFSSSIGPFSVDYFGTKGFDVSAADIGLENGYLWWMIGHETDAGIGELTLLSCNPYIDSLLVDTTFKLPGYAIDESRPPRPDESTATFLSNDSSAINPPITPSSILGSLDDLFQAVVWGVDGTPIEDLVGEANVPRLLAKSERTYAQLVAQSLHFNYRSTTTAALAGPFNGTVTDSNRTRLVQNALSTRLLEGILLFMALCAGLSFALERATRILPKNPGSIASSMSLFADSEMLGLLSHEAASSDWDKPWRSRALAGRRYRLGWWNADDRCERFGIDFAQPDQGRSDDGTDQDTSPSLDRDVHALDV